MALGQIIVNWLLLGGFYAAVALGFSLVWGIMNIVNLAHGSFVIVGAYVAYLVFTNYHIDPFAAILASMLTLFIVGWIIQYVAINRVIRAPFLVTFMLTFGLDLLLTDIVQQLFTSDLRSITATYAGKGLSLGSTRIPYDRVGILVIAVLLTWGLNLFLTRTRTGNAILATGMDRDAARLMGVNIARIYALTFGISAALAGAAGAMLAQIYPFAPSDAGTYTLRAFVIVVLGGLGTPWAALAGGMLFALAETALPLLPGIGPGYENVIAFGVLVLVLIVRPTGLLGKAFYA
jgi:branched-chain amino acid transport system permease protein